MQPWPQTRFARAGIGQGGDVAGDTLTPVTGLSEAGYNGVET